MHLPNDIFRYILEFQYHEGKSKKTLYDIYKKYGKMYDYTEYPELFKQVPWGCFNFTPRDHEVRLKSFSPQIIKNRNKMIKQFEIDPTICLRTHSRVINDFSYYEYLPIKKRRLIKNFASSFDCETGKYMNKNSRFEYIEVYPIPKLDKHVVFTSTKPGNCEWFRERGFSRYPKILFSHYYTYVRII